MIERLTAMGVKNTIMLTGDNSVVARAVSRRLGLTRHFADMLPGDKADVVQELQREGNIVAMVGDGINDLPALSFADVGVAMKHGAQVTHESADVVLMEELAVEAGQGDRNLSGFRRAHQTELLDCRCHEHDCACVGVARWVDQPIRHRADQQRLRHYSKWKQHASSFAILMAAALPEVTLSPSDLEALKRAFFLLERSSFARQLADSAGQPATYLLNKILKTMNRRLNRMAEIAIFKGLDVAVKSLKSTSERGPATKLSSVVAGISGGVSGFFGTVALPVELPLTTVVMLRAIADIARHQGEDLATIEGRLACVEVFALGDRGGSNTRTEIGYYATRALLSRLTKDAAGFLSECGAANASAPLVGSFVSEVAARFGTVVSERAAVGAVPILGALGGATVNVIFMNHFQNIAQGHFIVRRLERQYGADVVRRRYARLEIRRTLPKLAPGSS